MKINGYNMNDLVFHVFKNFEKYTKAGIDESTRDFENAFFSGSQDNILISLGENCGPGVKLREASKDIFGSFFFDNIVCPVDSINKLFECDFTGLFDLRYLTIGTWEGHDSVYNTKYGIYFHHYFHLRGAENEKSRFLNGNRIRQIDEEDIPLFLPQVQSQFEYLLNKLRITLLSPQKKTFIFRKVNGSPLRRVAFDNLYESIKRWGANNFNILVVYSSDGDVNSNEFYEDKHILIPEVGVRWGEKELWESFLSSL
ncbi:DUF1796 family putative cysteine peptidase [Neptunomonas phycophila]|uniref:DUF1796 family putative cysteine peptidase n=1 Tax=Neptunomonas phycophila TaxID=1572645 RepID=UPI0026E20B2B|nr:DUF1796 family putative cysteine peptidase [Neptunomonas phycophila]MDO6467095.1 DUF1796 family putative cysteine peptidase [Neptunomonas phycophila]